MCEKLRRTSATWPGPDSVEVRGGGRHPKLAAARVDDAELSVKLTDRRLQTGGHPFPARLVPTVMQRPQDQFESMRLKLEAPQLEVASQRPGLHVRDWGFHEELLGWGGLRSHSAPVPSSAPFTCPDP